jgi:hypothetical protein
VDSGVEINFAFKHQVMQLIKEESELSKDISPTLFLKGKDERLRDYIVDTTQDGKYVWMSVVAPILVRMHQTEMFCFVSSAWGKEVDPGEDLSNVEPPSKSEDRFEMIIAAFGNKHGRMETWINLHTRGDDERIELGEWEYNCETTDSITASILEAIVAAA